MAVPDRSAPPKGPPRVLRGALVWLRADPFLTDPAEALVHVPDGAVVCRDGLIEAVGDWADLKGRLPDGAAVTHYPDALITPGFIDCHVHYVQTEMIAAFGSQLLDWLERHAFPAEQAFADPAHAAMVAKVFCDELVRNGTTTALVFCSSHPQSVEALFAEALSRDMRLIAGKTMMDRNAPDGLRDTAQGSYDDSKALLERWHGRGRLGYAITPRFAGSSTPEQLALAGALWSERPDVHVHSHISENLEEIAWIKNLYPERSGYLDVYDHAGLVGPRALFAHGVHLSEGEFCRCHETGAALAHCPTSNMFLGSGQFRVFDAKRSDRPVHVGLGTDIGAGTSFSILATMGEAYKAAQLNKTSLDAVKALYLATLGGARALGLEDRIGAIKAGNEADLVVLDPKATPLLKFRTERARSIEELLFVLMTLGDDRVVRETWIAGAKA
ncbi:MAG: guanine deaminase [Caulobacter sp.]|nr:guanine deaminase [Caulobacter sp.]